MRRRFFVEEFKNDSAILSGDTANHLGRVLRAETGQLYELSDGESVWLARTDHVGRDEVRFALVERLPIPAATLQMTLLLAIVKFDRFEWAIEKATELGVDDIVPIDADRSERGLTVAAAKRAARWQRILIESAQQARRLRVPILHETAKSIDAFRSAGTDLKLLLSERSGANPMRTLLEPVSGEIRKSPSTTVTIAIGPEGGWTEAEFAAAASCGFSEAALGANILRTETAVCSSLAAVQYAFGTFRPSESAGKEATEVSEGQS